MAWKRYTKDVKNHIPKTARVIFSGPVGAYLNGALIQKLGVTSGDKYDVFVDEDQRVVGFVFKKTGRYVSGGGQEFSHSSCLGPSGSRVLYGHSKQGLYRSCADRSRRRELRIGGLAA
jgi:hypothetical protein